MKATSLLVAATSLAAGHNSICSDGFQPFVFFDQHDGDQKQVTLTQTMALKILPYNNSQVWEIHSTVDPDKCTAVIDFNVPGKPSPPPVNLLATIYKLVGSSGSDSRAIVFTDPSGTIAKPTVPLNTWIEG